MRHILLVEDDAIFSKAMSALLRQHGFEAKAFHTGSSVLKHVDNPTCAMPAAIVVDIHLPDINGLVLSRKLRERFGEDLPIIVLSGDTSMETINSLPHVGADYFFPKPVSATHFIKRLKEWTTSDIPVRSPDN